MSRMTRILSGAACALALACSLGGAAWAQTQPTSAQIELIAFRAELGDAAAQTSLGDLHYYGRGVSQNNAEALRWYRLAAAQGHARAQANLGFAYEVGHGVARDRAQAASWYRRALATDPDDTVARTGLARVENVGATRPN